VEDAVDLVVEMHRPWQGVDALPAFQDEAFDAVVAEQGGDSQPGRAGADDYHRRRAVVVGAHTIAAVASMVKHPASAIVRTTLIVPPSVRAAA
jgi:hypothetical protein